MIDKIIGRDPNCFTGGDCWNYDYSDRWLSILIITISIYALYRLIKKVKVRRRER